MANLGCSMNFYWDWYYVDDSKLEIEMRITSDHPDYPVIAVWKKVKENADGYALIDEAHKMINDLREGIITIEEAIKKEPPKRL